MANKINNLSDVEEIIAKKIELRIKRKEGKESAIIQEIVEECCNYLHCNQPEIIFCDTVMRNLSAFFLRGKPYIIFDNSLLEALYLFDALIISHGKNQDIDKFFCKVFSEELLVLGDLVHSLYFLGRYEKADFSFSKEEEGFAEEIKFHLSRQIYFLIGHELTHLVLGQGSDKGIPSKFIKFVQVGTRLLLERFLKEGMSETELLSQVSNYFLIEGSTTFDEYMQMLGESSKFYYFVEECYCDFMSFKLLMEQYEDANKSMAAISDVLNFLITMEYIKESLDAGILHVSDKNKEAQNVLFFSVLRMQILLIVLQENDLEEAFIAYDEIYSASDIFTHLPAFIEQMADPVAMALINESYLPDIHKKHTISYILRNLYCLDIG